MQTSTWAGLVRKVHEVADEEPVAFSFGITVYATIVYIRICFRELLILIYGLSFLRASLFSLESQDEGSLTLMQTKTAQIAFR